MKNLFGGPKEPRIKTEQSQPDAPLDSTPDEDPTEKVETIKQDIQNQFEQLNAQIDDLQKKNDQDFREYRSKITATIAQKTNELDKTTKQDGEEKANQIVQPEIGNLAFFPPEDVAQEQNENLTSHGQQEDDQIIIKNVTDKYGSSMSPPIPRSMAHTQNTFFQNPQSIHRKSRGQNSQFVYSLQFNDKKNTLFTKEQVKQLEQKPKSSEGNLSMDQDSQFKNPIVNENIMDTSNNNSKALPSRTNSIVGAQRPSSQTTQPYRVINQFDTKNALANGEGRYSNKQFEDVTINILDANNFDAAQKNNAIHKYNTRKAADYDSQAVSEFKSVTNRPQFNTNTPERLLKPDSIVDQRKQKNEQNQGNDTADGGNVSDPPFNDSSDISSTDNEGEIKLEAMSPDEIKELLDEKEREYKEIEALGNSMWITDMYVDAPWKVVFFGAAVIGMFSLVCAGFELYWPSPITNRDLLDYSDLRTLMFDMREAAQGVVQAAQNEDGLVPLQTVPNIDWTLVIAVECNTEGCDNVITPRGMLLLEEIEKLIIEDPNWSKVCLFHGANNQTCANDPNPENPVISIAHPLLLFKIAYPEEEVKEYTQYGIDFALFGASQSEQYFNFILPLFSSDFNIKNRKAKKFRIMIQCAGPIDVEGKRFSTMRDRSEQQEFFIANWQVDLNDKIIELMKDFDDFRVHTFGRAYVYRQFYKQLLWDVLWGGLATAVVYSYVLLHVKSVFIANSSMSMILFSFPITLVIYKLFMRVTNLSSLHLMILFVILGISADNIFVTWDAWQQSDSYPQFTGNLNKRMAYTIRRAYKAILATSSTTAFAFLSNGFSSLMPVSAFGYFAAVVVPVNYVLIVFYFPAFIILYEKKVKHYEAAFVQCLCNSVKCVYCCNVYKMGRKIARKNRRKQRRREAMEEQVLDGTMDIYKNQKGNSHFNGKKIAAINEPMELMNGINSHNDSQIDTVKNMQGAKDAYTEQPVMDVAEDQSLKIIAHQQDQNQDIFRSNLRESNKIFKNTDHSLIQSNDQSSNIDKLSISKAESQQKIFQSNYLNVVNEGGNEDFRIRELEGGEPDSSTIHRVNQESGGEIRNETGESINKIKLKIEQSGRQNFSSINGKDRDNYTSVQDVHPSTATPQEMPSALKSMKTLHNTGLPTVKEITVSAVINTSDSFQEENQKKGQERFQDQEANLQINQNQKNIQEMKIENQLETVEPQKKDKYNQEELEKIKEQFARYEVQTDKVGSLERFFDGPWNNIVRFCRWPIILIGLAAGAYAGWRSMEIQGLSKMEEYFTKDHYITQALDKTMQEFNDGQYAQTIVVDIMWGVENINKTGVDFFNASDIGTAIWDNEFEMSSEESQRQILDFCLEIKNQSDILYSNGSVKCWIDDFRAFLFSRGERFPVKASIGLDGRYPTAEDHKFKFLEMVKKFIKEDQYGIRYKEDTSIGIVDGELKYMKFTAKASGGIYDPYFLKNPIYEQWEQVLADFRKTANPGINNPKQTAGMDWCLMITELKLVETMFEGLYYSITFCVIALTIATMNIVQAFWSALTIGLIITNTMGMVAYQGWELGSAESVGVVVCVGFAVDYVVHLAAHFVHSKGKDRNSRVRESLREIGISILSGSVTTVAATATLFICVLVIFSKFAMLVIWTIILSTFYSLAFFSALCQIFGPMGNFGNIQILYTFLRDILMKRNKDGQSSTNNEVAGSSATASENQPQRENQIEIEEIVQSNEEKANNGETSKGNNQKSNTIINN